MVLWQVQAEVSTLALPWGRWLRTWAKWSSSAGSGDVGADEEVTVGGIKSRVTVGCGKWRWICEVTSGRGRCRVVEGCEGEGGAGYPGVATKVEVARRW